MATASTYCTQRDVKDVFPNISEFDNKEAIYGFISDTHDSITYYVYYMFF